MPNMSIASSQRHGFFRPKRGLQGLVMLALLATFIILGGCGDDDDTFEGADVSEIQNTTWTFGDLRVFSLPNQSGTLTIGTFGSDVLEDDEAPFTLTLAAGQANTGTATGTVDLDEGDNPLGEDFSTCQFEIATSNITPPVAGLTDGDANDTDCIVSADGSELQLTNRRTDEVSTGTLQ